MTKKEKLITEILYEEYRKSGSRYLTHSSLVGGSRKQLTGPELAIMFDHGKSRYFQPKGGYNAEIEITFEGIEYMENMKKRIIKEWIVIIASVLAAVFGLISILK